MKCKLSIHKNSFLKIREGHEQQTLRKTDLRKKENGDKQHKLYRIKNSALKRPLLPPRTLLFQEYFSSIRSFTALSPGTGKGKRGCNRENRCAPQRDIQKARPAISDYALCSRSKTSCIWEISSCCASMMAFASVRTSSSLVWFRMAFDISTAIW